MSTPTPDTTPGRVHLHVTDRIAAITFDRPAARNAMTWAMYQQLGEICVQLQAMHTEGKVRVAVFRGAGGQAFVAGTDIEQFTAFTSGEDGVAYEKQIDAGIAALEKLPMPTVAVIEGWAIGGGLAMATACDFRLATPDTRFGVPIARTLGNCLSVANIARLVAAFGHQRVKRMLMLAETLTADEALACGYLAQVVDISEMDAARDTLVQKLAKLAPVTQQVSKEALRRLSSHHLPEGEDLIRQCYGSGDFREGVTAFVGKRGPVWTGK